jgi:GntR family transcriptional regulator, carbon starvation induced regulator
MFVSDGTLDPEWEARNVAFHESLYDACGSPSLKLVCHVLYERHSRYRRLRTRQGDPTRSVSKEHEALMRATISRDGDTAVALLRKHRSATLADVAAGWPAREEVSLE